MQRDSSTTVGPTGVMVTRRPSFDVRRLGVELRGQLGVAGIQNALSEGFGSRPQQCAQRRRFRFDVVGDAVLAGPTAQCLEGSRTLDQMGPILAVSESARVRLTRLLMI